MAMLIEKQYKILKKWMDWSDEHKSVHCPFIYIPRHCEKNCFILFPITRKLQRCPCHCLPKEYIVARVEQFVRDYKKESESGFLPEFESDCITRADLKKSQYRDFVSFIEGEPITFTANFNPPQEDPVITEREITKAIHSAFEQSLHGRLAVSLREWNNECFAETMAHAVTSLFVKTIIGEEKCQ